MTASNELVNAIVGEAETFSAEWDYVKYGPLSVEALFAGTLEAFLFGTYPEALKDEMREIYRTGKWAAFWASFRDDWANP